MKISDWLHEATQTLETHDIETARLDCLILLEDILGKDKAFLLAHSEFEISKAQQHRLEMQIKQRQDHTPLAYIRGKTEFYGREFFVNKDVLVPRPESETMVELLLQSAVKDQEVQIIDIGTGSGALAISAKLELPKSTVIGIDIDKKCLTVAKKNALQLQANVTFMHGDLLEPIKNNTQANVLLCNLPYIPDNFTLNQAAMNEPRLAIFGGKDGLDYYRKLFGQIKQLTTVPQLVLTEALPLQHTALMSIATHYQYKQLTSQDFIQVFTLSH